MPRTAPIGCLRFKTPQASTAVKKAGGSNHTYAATVSTLRLDPGLNDGARLAAYLQENRGKETDFARFEILSHSEEPTSHAGRPCSRYSVAARDRGVVPDAALPMNMAGITCIHPEKPDWGVDVGYSERGGSDRFSDDLLALGERFIGSLRFFPAGERPAIKQAYEAVKNGDSQRAKELIEPLIQAGDRFAAMRLGQILFASKSDDDKTLARKYFELGAADGHVDALYNLGAIYDKAIGVPRDVATAMRWFTLAADQRDAQAQLNLGILHHPRGNGVVKDVDVANRWLRMAADNGNSTARRLIGER